MGVEDLLRRDWISPAERARLATALASGPWCWPREARLEGVGVGLAGPRPPVPIGSCLLVTHSEVVSGLWLDSLPRGVEAIERPLGPDAQAAWQAAVTALHRALPYLTARPRGWDRLPRGLYRVAYQALSGHRPAAGAVVDGPSFGLAFLLGRASYLMEHPVPVTMVASATVAADGNLGGVDGLRGKLEVISQWARQVRTLLVAASQRDEWQAQAEALEIELEILGFDRASQVLEHVFAAHLRQRIEGMVGEAREELTERMFRLTLGERSELVDWLPVVATTARARAVWRPDDSSSLGWRLLFAQAVAARHEGRAVELTLPPPELFASLPHPRKLGVAAHLVMHTADAGSPHPSEVEAFVAPLLERTDSAEAQKLVGARARQLARRGEFLKALTMQQRAARYFEAVDAHDQLSYPLSEWYRLCGCLEAEEGLAALAEADRFQANLSCQPLAPDGQAYADLHRASSLVRLGAVDQRSLDFLEARFGDFGVASHIRYSSMRLLALHRRVRGDEDGAAEVIVGLDHASRHDSDPGQARIFLGLALLDRAVAAGDENEARAALEVFRQHFPAIVDELLAVRDDPAFVARGFPY